MLANTRRHCPSKSSAPTSLPLESVATCPAMNSSSDALTREICEYRPRGLPSASGFAIVISDMVAPHSVVGRISRNRNDRQQEMRGIFGVVINLVQHGLAAADVVRNVFHIGSAADAGCDVEARNFNADTVAPLELIGGRPCPHSVVVALGGAHGSSGG